MAAPLPLRRRGGAALLHGDARPGVRCGILMASTPAVASNGGGRGGSARRGGGAAAARGPRGWRRRWRRRRRRRGRGSGEGSGEQHLETRRAFAQSAGMFLARTAAALIDHLGLLDQLDAGFFVLSSGGGETPLPSIGEQGDKLQYDAAAEKALMVFPRSHHSTARATTTRRTGRAASPGHRVVFLFSSSSSAAVVVAAAGCGALQVVDRTVSAGGGRRLRRWLRRPVTSLAELRARHGLVAPSWPRSRCGRGRGGSGGPAPNARRRRLASTRAARERQREQWQRQR